MEKFGVLDELEIEYRKIYNDYGKKNNNIKESFEIMFKTISNLKNYASKIDLGIKNNIEQFLKPISLISLSDNRNVKLYSSLLLIIKKLITSNLINNNNLNTIIIILKDVIENSTDEFNHIKVLETLLLLINPEFLSISEILVDNILTICYKSISHKNNNIKNTVSAILQQLTSISFYSLEKLNDDSASQKSTKHNNEDHKSENLGKTKSSSKNETNKINIINPVNNEISKVCQNLFKEYMLISEGKGRVQNMIYSRAVGIELLSGIIQSYPMQILNIEFFMNKIAELSKIIKKNLESTTDYIIGTILSIQIIEKLKTGYNIIPCLLKYVERQTNNWQKYIGLECISSILNDTKIITDLFLLNKSHKSEFSTSYLDLMNTLMKVTYTINNIKQLDIKKDKKTELIISNYRKRVTKYIDLSSFMMDSDNNNPPSLTHASLMHFIFECFNNLINSFTFMIENSKMKIDSINNNLTREQQLIKDIIILSVDCIKNSLTVFLTISPDENSSQSIIKIFQSFLLLFGCLGLDDAKNSLIKELLKISYNSEIKESNKFLIKGLFGIIDSVSNFLDQESWAMILEWNIKIYLYLANCKNSLVNPNEEEFNMDYLIRRIENNVKKNYKEIETRKENNNRSMIIIKGTKEMEDLNHKQKVIDDTAIQETGSLTNRERKGGLLSSIKNVFGIKNLNKEASTAPQTKGSITTMRNEEDIFESLLNILENVFINSMSFSNYSLIAVFNGLEKNANNISTIYGNNQNEEYKTCFHFIFVKILELVIVNVKRIDIFLEKVHLIISSIIKTDNSKISKFCIELLTSITLYILSNFKIVKDSHSLWEKTTWQKNVFKIYTIICKDSTNTNIKVNIVEGISNILYTSSNLISSQGYFFIIEICDFFISNAKDVLFEKVSFLINNLFNEYKENIHVLHLKNLSDILAKRCSVGRDLNEMSSEISMFTGLSDLIEKFQQFVKLPFSEVSNIKFLNKEQKEFYRNEENKSELFNSLWINLFQNFLSICKDNSLDVQKLAIITFGEILVKKHSLILDELAIVILNNFLFILEKNYSTYKESLSSTQQKHEEENQIKTPKFSSGFVEDSKKPGKKTSAIKFDDETLKKFNILPHSEDPSKLEEICILLLLEIGRILKHLFSNSDKERDNQITWDKLLSDYILILRKIIKMSSMKLLINCLRTLRDLFFLKNEIIYKYIWNLLNDLGAFITSEFFLTTLLKDEANTLISDIIDFLNEIFVKNENDYSEKELSIEENLIALFNFINNTLFLAKNIDFLQGITNPQKLNKDEKIVFEFIENLVPLLNSYQSKESFCKYILSFMKYDHKIDHSEAICRKSFELLDYFFEHIEDDDLKFKYLPQILSEVKQICSYISNFDISNSNKSQMQLWQHSLFILLKIIRTLFEKNISTFDNYMTQQNEQKTSEIAIATKSQYSSLKGKQNFLEILSEKDRLAVWEHSVNCLESIFNYTGSILKASDNFSVSKNILEDLIRSCQEMNIQIITFIVNILIPNSFTIEKNIQTKLFTLLDIGCNFDLNSNIQLSSSSFSRIVISNLFDLCKFQDEKTTQIDIIGISNIDEFNRIKEKINKITTPILIKKCREILKKYIDDENRSGSIPLSRNRIEDVKFVLENLKALEIISSASESDDPEVITNMDLASNNYFQNAVANSKRAHLFNLIHTFSDLVMTKENEIRLIVKEIFKIISNEIYSQKI